ERSGAYGMWRVRRDPVVAAPSAYDPHWTSASGSARRVVRHNKLAQRVYVLDRTATGQALALGRRRPRAAAPPARVDATRPGHRARAGKRADLRSGRAVARGPDGDGAA